MHLKIKMHQQTLTLKYFFSPILGLMIATILEEHALEFCCMQYDDELCYFVVVVELSDSRRFTSEITEYLSQKVTRDQK